MHTAEWIVEKYNEDIERVQLPWWRRLLKFLPKVYDVESFRAKFKPYEVLRLTDNVLLNAGITELWEIVTGTGTFIPYNAANSYVGVGDGSTAEAPTQTGLVGTNRLFKLVDSGYPQVSGQTAIWQATFGGTEANFAWNEGGVANGNNPPTTGIMLNRKVSAMGTKASGQTWILQVRITLS